MIATHESIESEIKQSYPSIHRLDGVPPPPGASLGPLNVQEPPHQTKKKRSVFLFLTIWPCHRPPSHPLSSPSVFVREASRLIWSS